MNDSSHHFGFAPPPFPYPLLPILLSSPSSFFFFLILHSVDSLIQKREAVRRLSQQHSRQPGRGRPSSSPIEPGRRRRSVEKRRRPDDEAGTGVTRSQKRSKLEPDLRFNIRPVYGIILKFKCIHCFHF